MSFEIFTVNASSTRCWFSAKKNAAGQNQKEALPANPTGVRGQDSNVCEEMD